VLPSSRWWCWCPTKKCNSFSLSSSRPPKAEEAEEAEEEDGLRRDEYRCEDQEDILFFFFFFPLSLSSQFAYFPQKSIIFGENPPIKKDQKLEI